MLSNNMRKLFLVGAVSMTLVAGGIAHAQEQDGAHQISTLEDALAIGIATNPEYGVVAASRRATDEELEQGEALFLPSVDLDGRVGFEYSRDPNTRDELGDDDNELLTREIGLTITQLLFDGYESHYEVKRQQARVKSAADRVRETAELVGLSIVESYLEVLRQRQLLDIAEFNVREHRSIMKQIDDGIRAGRQTQADGEQIRSRLASARAAEASTREALRFAESEYKREVGDLPGNIEMPLPPYEALESDVEQEVMKSLSYSPTLDIFASDIEVAYAEARGTRSTQYPQVDLQLNGRTGSDLGGNEGSDTSASALVVMNWNLYRGGADIARAREFNHRHQQSKEARTEAARTLENDVRQTWASMVAAGERAARFSEQAAANSKVVTAYKDQFGLNRRTLLDVLDSQNELFVSRSDTVNAEFLELFAVYRLLALKGELLPTLGLEYPRESKVASGDVWSYEQRQDAR